MRLAPAGGVVYPSMLSDAHATESKPIILMETMSD